MPNVRLYAKVKVYVVSNQLDRSASTQPQTKLITNLECVELYATKQSEFTR